MSKQPKTFIISDTHFSHDNILKFEGEARPFETVEEHDEELIRRWNSVVGENDKVIHLGDVAFKPATQLDAIMPRLNGKKTLILGNHDVTKMERYLAYFDKVLVCLEDKKRGILFSHYPVHPSQLDYRYKVNVHGHTHSFIIDDPRYINVCSEHLNLTPLSIIELREEVKKRIEIIESQE